MTQKELIDFLEDIDSLLDNIYHYIPVKSHLKHLTSDTIVQFETLIDDLKNDN